MGHSLVSMITLGLFLGLLTLSRCYIHTPERVEEHQSGIPRERELANRLLHRLMDVAYETFKEMGGSEPELKEMQRKRSYIQTCYFQAVTCY